MSPITTHILDTGRGCPAQGVPTTLARCHASSEGGAWTELGRGVTDEDGRLKTLMEAGRLEAGTYRIHFDLRAYFAGLGQDSFYPEASVIFEVKDPSEHYHVPLLLSPFGYSTYRGS